MDAVHHYTIEKVIRTLQNMQVVPVDVIGYLAAYQGSEISSTLNTIFGLDLNKKYYLPKELNKQAKANVKSV